MPIESTPIRPKQRVDIGALSGGFQNECAQVVAKTLVRTLDHLAEMGEALNQAQKIELVRVALQEFDGLELSVARELERRLAAGDVPDWGLPGESLDEVLAPKR